MTPTKKVPFPEHVKDQIKSEIINELENRKVRLDSADIDYLVDRVQSKIKTPKLDNKEILVGLLNQIVLTEEEKKLAFNKEKILTPEVRADFINEILNKIDLPKDGKPGKKGEKGKDGKDYRITDQDKLDIAEVVDLSAFMTKEGYEQRTTQFVKDIRSGKIKLPAHAGASGPDIISKINNALDTEDWQNGLPGDGELGGNLEWIDLTDSPTDVPTGAGVMSWNNNELALDIQTGLGPTLQVGQEIYILICNCTGAPINNFTALRPLGATVKNGVIIPTVQLAKADEFATSEGTLMVSTMDIPDDTIGLATRFGRVRDADTSAFSDGDGLFLSATTEGGFTKTQPAFPNYAISMGGVIKSDANDGEFVVSITRDIFDTTLNFWNGTFRESIDFLVSSNGTTVTGSLSPSNGHPDMTMIFSSGLSMLTTTPPATIALTPGTDDNPQLNYIYVPESTKVLTVSTSDWPNGTEHIKVATVLLRSAATTQTDGALKNHNWNDHIQSTIDNQGHLSHITEKLRQFEAQWESGAQTTASGFPSNFYVSSTSGVIYQLHRQTFPAQSMPTDDMHVVNNFANPYVTVTNLNTQTLDALGNGLANSSFSFVIWGVQNKSGEKSHLMCNLPTGTYAKNSPALAVSDAFNYSVYNIPKAFQGTGFLLARFTLVLEADGVTWSLYDAEDLRGKIPNTTAGGGGGGAGVTEWTGLTDTPNAYTSQAGKSPRVNSGETGLEFYDPSLLVSAVSSERNATTQTLPTSTETTLIFDLENYDIGGEYDNTTGVFTCSGTNTVVRGVCASVVINHNPGGNIELRMYKNATLITAEDKTPATAGTTKISLSCQTETTSGDTLDVRVFQITGSTATLIQGTNTRFTISKMGELP
jgi:hypothetical protein